MSAPRICIVGGVFDNPESRRRAHAPEMVLADGLRSLGVDVTACGHADFAPSDDFDVVHVHHLGRAAMAMASSAGRSRLVFTGHDGRIVCGYGVSRRRSLAFRFVVGRSDATVALSDREREILRPLAGRDALAPVTIANGFPSEVFRDGPRHARSPEDRRLLFVGQLLPQKGLDVLFEALTMLRPGRRVALRLVFHNARLESHYRDEAARLGLGDRVEFAGFRAGEALADEYRSADFLILPTYAEALSSVIIEAMMCGTPVISSRIGGIPEQVGRHGRVVEPGDPRALAATIDAALDDADAGRFAPAAIAAEAHDAYRVDAMAEAHLSLYRTAMGSGRPPARARARYRLVNAGARALIGTLGPSIAGRGLLT